MPQSTLLTSRGSQLDFGLRLAFFALAPVAIVPLTLLFPVTGTLLSVGLGLVVFVTAETLRRWAGRSWLVRVLVGRELEMEQFYRRWPPRPFRWSCTSKRVANIPPSGWLCATARW